MQSNKACAPYREEHPQRQFLGAEEIQTYGVEGHQIVRARAPTGWRLLALVQSTVSATYLAPVLRRGSILYQRELELELGMDSFWEGLVGRRVPSVHVRWERARVGQGQRTRPLDDAADSNLLHLWNASCRRDDGLSKSGCLPACGNTEHGTHF